MKNFVANGESLQLTAGVGGVVGGSIKAQGKIVGIVVASAAEGEKYTLKICGAYDTVPKATGEAWIVGDMLYLKADGSELTKTSTSNTFAGYAYADALSADTTGSIKLSH
jgi:predicted RecA/RadA family phage recombinase